jgi:hypothetical protein
MLHGRKRIAVNAPIRAAPVLVALALLVASAIAVWALVEWGEAA